MSARPRLLDLFCCEGGASVGYMRAGWNVTAVDLDRNRAARNPADEVIVADAIDYLADNAHRFDAVHLSPPCQWYTRGNAKDRGKATKWERSIPTAREAALATGLPYVLENVKDAGWDMLVPVALCGCMFDLSTIDTDGIRINLQRPRLFETNWGLMPPRACDHSAHEWVAGAYGGARRDKYEAKYVRKGGYVPPSKDVVKALLGIEHDMTWGGLFECIPPAYSGHVGTQLLAHIEGQAAA
jgi:DNA (cytosine-5)-methyltransferase 1